ncbi:MAG TPA: NIPSNAP family protein [Bacteroidales bacterium]|jgi:hypothetical protein|nr:NIPSNAP family protein [Bacteroidales bacterium]
MKRRSFIKNSAIAAGAISATSIPVFASASTIQVTDKNIIEWRVYHLSRTPNSRDRINQYFTEALIPFLKKRNVQFFQFNEYSKNEPVVLYVMVAYPTISTYFSCMKDLDNDTEYLEASKNYRNTPASQATYGRYETFLLEAFDNFPVVKMPSGKGLFEMRLYESATEDAGRRKIAMFNKEEIAVFLKTGINPVFFGKIIAGQYMPALLYMVAFNDMTERDASWAKFSQDPDWIAMREKPEYADTVSNIQRVFLLPEGA